MGSGRLHFPSFLLGILRVFDIPKQLPQPIVSIFPQVITSGGYYQDGKLLARFKSRGWSSQFFIHFTQMPLTCRRKIRSLLSHSQDNP